MKNINKTDKEIKIDEIIRLAKEVNDDNKKFVSSEDNFTIQNRHDVLDYYFKDFQHELITDKNTVDIANKFHVGENNSLNITKSKVFYMQIDDKKLDMLLNSLRDLKYGKKAKKGDKDAYEVTIDGKVETRVINEIETFDGWKKDYYEYIKNKMPIEEFDIKKFIHEAELNYFRFYLDFCRRFKNNEDMENSIKSLIDIKYFKYLKANYYKDMWMYDYSKIIADVGIACGIYKNKMESYKDKEPFRVDILAKYSETHYPKFYREFCLSFYNDEAMMVSIKLAIDLNNKYYRFLSRIMYGNIVGDIGIFYGIYKDYKEYEEDFNK